MLVISSQLSAQTESPLVQSAKQQYDEGLYAEALLSYKELLGQGYTSAQLYYNLGNVHFKLNNVASSIWYFEKAVKLSPHDADINFNLIIANQRIVDKIDKVPESFLSTTFRSYRNMMSTDHWAKMAIVLFILSLAAVLLYLMGSQAALRRIALLVGFALFVVFVQSFVMAQQNYNAMVSEDFAITFESTINVMSEPKEESTLLFVIHEGLKVQIIENSGGWYKIKLVNGKIGWLNESTLQII